MYPKLTSVLPQIGPKSSPQWPKIDPKSASWFFNIFPPQVQPPTRSETSWVSCREQRTANFGGKFKGHFGTVLRHEMRPEILPSSVPNRAEIDPEIDQKSVILGLPRAPGGVGEGLGSVLGCLGGVLNRLGGVWGHPGAVYGPSWRHRTGNVKSARPKELHVVAFL